MDYLNPKILESSLLEEIGANLRQGKLVVLRDALLPELAEYVFQDLDRSDIKWELQEDYSTYGFTYYHHNVYEDGDKTAIMREVSSLFSNEETKRWITELSGRDCMGEDNPAGTASRYFPGDYSLPHSDHDGQRTVAFVWHLTKDWIPEWGGALYWCGEYHERAYVQASFNTLHLFPVTWHSGHFVTTVSRHAESKRLAFNGWWDAAYWPSDEDPLEVGRSPLSAQELYSSPEARLTLTKDQTDSILEMDFEGIEPEERRQALKDLQNWLWWEYVGMERKSSFIWPSEDPGHEAEKDLFSDKETLTLVKKQLRELAVGAP